MAASIARGRAGAQCISSQLCKTYVRHKSKTAYYILWVLFIRYKSSMVLGKKCGESSILQCHCLRNTQTANWNWTAQAQNPP